MVKKSIFEKIINLIAVVCVFACSFNIVGCNSSSVNPLDGELSLDYTVKTENKRDDFDEIISPVNSSNLSSKCVGGAEKLADSMRKNILNTKNTEEIYDIKGTKYYVSPGGNDENDGKSPENAIRTVYGIKSLVLKEGDAVLFERDSVFRLSETLNTVDGVIYGSYGKGQKPKIYASPKNFAKEVWKPSEMKNIWYITWIYAEAGNIYFDHGKEIGCLKRSVDALKKNGDFCDINGNFYLYYDKGNPAKEFETIDIAIKVSNITITPRTGATIDNLCLKYSSYFGIQGYFDCKNVIVTNCEIGYIGGWIYNEKVRAGNAIQCWSGVEKFHVSNCWIYQTFDTAISWQGNDEENLKYTDIVFKDNLTEYNNADYEFWSHGTTLGDMTIENNLMRFTALGWGTREYDGGIRGIEGAFVAITSSMNHAGKIIIKDNTFDCPARKIFDWNVINKDSNIENWSHYEISGSKVYWKENYRTTEEVIRNCEKKADDPFRINAKTKDSVLMALQKFDTTTELIWLN